ncbi:MAG: hypothetical protein ABJQ89_13540, partial [Planktotalea sp.]
QRNHHAHVLTTTWQLEAEGFTTKTLVLDAAKTGGVEIAQMREGYLTQTNCLQANATVPLREIGT